VWSPDGSRIAFTGKVFGETVFVLSLSDSRRYVPVTGARVNAGEFNRNPTWSSDSRKIAFESNRDGTIAIYTVNADGSVLAKAGTVMGREPSCSR
jgi:Tol biopolymer transport system component